MADSTKDKMLQVLSNMIDRKGIVFWYDEGGQMQDFADSLELDGVEVLLLDHNAFTLKHRILKGEQPERGFIVYSTEARPAEDENNWLLDLEVSGAMFSADMGSLYAAECGIAMELKTKAVDPHMTFFSTADNRQRLQKRVTSNMNVADIECQMMAVICKTESSYDKLTFALAKETLDGKEKMMEKLTAANLADNYWNMVEQAFGYDKERGMKDLVIALFLDDLDHYVGKGKLNNEARIFMRDWRDSRNYGEMYSQWAELLEQELNIYDRIKEWSFDQLVAVDTFPCVDKLIAQHLQMEVANSTMSVETMEGVVDVRQGKIFWHVARHTIQALLEARRLLENIDQKMAGLVINSAEEGFMLYQNELYAIDLHYRHYFREAHEAESKNLLVSITEKVQRVYTNGYLMTLANKWQPMVDGMQKWQINGYITQRSFYNYFVDPFVRKGTKVFVIISDALRYETMVELEQRIAALNRMKTEMKPPMVSTLPSYTQLGMAALLPQHELSYESDKDVAYADGQSTKGTESRKKVLQGRVSASLALTAENFLETKDVKNAFKDFHVIYIYSDKIDKVGDDKATEREVFKATEEEFERILKIVELIRNANGSNIFITTDHGYLYQNEELDESEFADFKIMGQSIRDTRRFVIGHNLQSGNEVNTWQGENVGLKAGIEVQTAKGLTRMRKKGAGSRFVHGGSMLQEIMVPVLHVNIGKKQDLGQVYVDILNQRSCLTTSSQTISFYQTEPVTEKVKGMTLRMGFYDENGELISDSFTMTFDIQSAESEKREQKHTFIFKQTLSRLNGNEVTLRMEKQVAGSEQWTVYKEVAYKVMVMFQAEF